MSNARKKRTQKSQTASLALAPSSAPFAFTPDQIVARLRCFSDGAEFEKDEWRQCLFAQAAAAIDRLMRETLGLRAALAYIADEANRHHEHNPISGANRLPRGYMTILNIADDALNPPNIKATQPGGQTHE